MQFYAPCLPKELHILCLYKIVPFSQFVNHLQSSIHHLVSLDQVNLSSRFSSLNWKCVHFVMIDFQATTTKKQHAKKPRCHFFLFVLTKGSGKGHGPVASEESGMRYLLQIALRNCHCQQLKTAHVSMLFRRDWRGKQGRWSGRKRNKCLWITGLRTIDTEWNAIKGDLRKYFIQSTEYPI